MAFEILITTKNLAEAGVTAAAKTLDQLKVSLSQINKMAEDLRSKGLTNLFSGLKTLGSISFPAAQAISFEKDLASLRATTELTAAEFTDLESTIRNMSKNSDRSFGELVDGFKSAIKEFGNVDIAKTLFEPAIQGSAVAGTTIGNQFKTINDLLKAYDKDWKSFAETQDIVTKVTKTMNVEFSDFSNAMRAIAPTAKSFQTDFKDTASILALLTQKTGDAGKAAQYFGVLLQFLGDAESQQSKELATLGIKVTDTQGKFRGLIPVFNDIIKSEIPVEKLTSVFGRLGTRAAITFKDIVPALKEFRTGLNSVEGLTIRTGQEIDDNLSNAMERLWNVVKLTASTIGGAVTSNRDLLESLISLIGSINDFISRHEKLTSVIVISVAAIGSLLVGIGALKIAIGSVLGAGIVPLAAGVKGLSLIFSSFSAFGFIDGLKFIGLEIKSLIAKIPGLNVLLKSTPWLIITGEIAALVKTYRDMNTAVDNMIKTDERNAATLQKGHDLALKVAQQSGVRIRNVEELNKAIISGIVVYDKETESWKKNVPATEAAAKSHENLKSKVVSSTRDIQNYLKKLQDGYTEAMGKAKEYGQAVIDAEFKIQNIKSSTADRIRELGRAGLTDEQQWNDKRAEADQKITALYELQNQIRITSDEKRREKLVEQFEALAGQTEGIFSGLATEIKSNDVVVKSLKDTTGVAIEGLNKISGFKESVAGIQKEIAFQKKSEIETQAAEIKKTFDFLNNLQGAVKISIDEPSYKKVTDNIEALKQSLKGFSELVISARWQESKTAGSSAAQGEGFAVGGLLPGYGGGDKIPINAEGGEYIIRKESVRSLGVRFLDYINSLGHGFDFSSTKNLFPRLGYATGGQVSGSGKNFGTLTLSLGGDSFPVMGSQDVLEGLTEKLSRMKLMRKS